MPDPLQSLPTAPRSLPKAGKSLWNHVGTLLIADGRLQSLHLPSFEQLCRDAAMIASLEAIIAREGYTMTEIKDTGATGLKARPEVQILAVVRRRFDALALSFGLTPTTTKKLPKALPQKNERIAAAQKEYARLVSEINNGRIDRD